LSLTPRLGKKGCFSKISIYVSNIGLNYTRWYEGRGRYPTSGQKYYNNPGFTLYRMGKPNEDLSIFKELLQIEEHQLKAREFVKSIGRVNNVRVFHSVETGRSKYW
jgi:hypothetical protein